MNFVFSVLILAASIFSLNFLPFANVIPEAIAANNSAQKNKDTALEKLLRDETTEVKIKYNLANNNNTFKKMRIRPLCFNGVVLLTGEVSSAKLKQQAAAIAKKTEGVRQVHNQLIVAGQAGYLSRMNDNWLAMKVKAKIMLEDDLANTEIHVASHQGTTYLMGRVNSNQAKKAVKIAREVGGVQKIVQVFDYH